MVVSTRTGYTTGSTLPEVNDDIMWAIELFKLASVVDMMEFIGLERFTVVAFSVVLIMSSVSVSGFRDEGSLDSDSDFV